MNRIAPLSIAAALAAWSAVAVAQDITFFEYPDFNGRRFAASHAVTNMGETGFNDRASSVVIRNGSWQLCTDSHFRGRCVTLEAGQYRDLAQIGMSNQVSSARQIGGSWGGGSGGGNWGGGSGGGSQGGSATLYDGYNFSGSSFGVDGDVSNLGRTNFNDRARSMIVNYGTWELCRDDGFRGGCQVYGPGRYANLGFLAGEASSIRRAGGGGGPGGSGESWPPGWGSQARVVLYEHSGFGGRSYPMTQEYVPNFASVGFNDRASSLRVERGYWLFCSDSNFQGTCRTFGPGDYPSLPPGLSNAISSGRRVHDDYPYRSNPNWEGYSQQ